MNTLDVNTAKRDEIAAELRNHHKPLLSDWITRNGFERQSDLTKADWQRAYTEIAGTHVPTPPTATPEPAKPAPAKPAPVDLSRTLDGLSLVLSDKAIEPLKAGIAKLEQERDTATRERDAAARLAAVAASKPAPVATLAPVAGSAPVAVPACQSTGLQNVGELFKGSRTLKARGIMMDVCDAADAPQIDETYMPPADTPDIYTAASLGFNVFFSGGAGTGKSSFVRDFAARLKRPYIQIGFHAETSSADLFGFEGPSPDGGTAWVPGDLLKAIQTPYAVIDLAEISFARPELTAELLSVLEPSDRSVHVGGVTYKVHPTVLFFATSNDNGTGENSDTFHGTRAMNPALMSRFQAHFEFAAPSAERMAKMIAKQANMVPDAARVIADFAKRLEAHQKQGTTLSSPTPRHLLAWAKLVVAGIPSKRAFEIAVLNGALENDRAQWAQEAAAHDPHMNIALYQKSPAHVPVDGDDDDDAPEIEQPTRSGFTPV